MPEANRKVISSKTSPALRTVRWAPPPALLVVILIIVILLVTWGSYTIYKVQENRIISATYKDLEYIAQFKVEQIQQWQQERLMDARFFASSPLFQQGVSNLNPIGEPLKISQSVIDRLEEMQSVYGYDSVLIVTPGGELCYPLLPATQVVDDETLALAQKAAQAGESIMGDLFISTMANKIVLDFAVPILSEQGTTQAILLLRVDPDQYLFPMVQDWPTPSKSGETLLVRKVGDSVLFLNTLRHTDSAPLTLKIPLSETAVPAVQAVQGQSGPLRGTDYRGVDVYAQTLAVGGTPWYMISKIDSSEVNKEVQQILWGLLVIDGMAVILAIVAGAMTVAKRQKDLYQKVLHVEREALIEHNLLSETLRASLDEIYLFDTVTYRFRFINDGALKNLGYSQDQMLYMTPLDIKPTLSEKDFARLLQPLLDGKQNLVVFETIHQRIDHSTYPVEVHVQLVDYGNEKVYLAVIQDISDRKLAAQKVKESYEKYRVLFYTFPHGLMVTDSEQVISEVNAATEEILKLPTRELLGKSYRNLSWRLVNRQGEPLEANEMASTKAMKANKPVMNIIMGVVPFTGETIWVNVSAIPIPLDQYGALLIIENITSRIQLEAELQHSQERYYYLVELSPEAIFVVRDNLIEFINPAGLKLFGAKSSDDLFGKPSIDFFHEDFHSQIRERLRLMQTEKRPVPLINQKIVRLDGEERDVEVSSSPFTDEKGLAIQVILRDITDRKLAEEKLQAQLAELARWHEATLGREARILELKEEVNQSLIAANLPPRYVTHTAGTSHKKRSDE